MGNINDIKKIRVLEIAHGLAPGGIEAFLLNIFENIDKEKIEISFDLASNGKQYHEERVLNQGAKVYHTNDLNGIKNICKHFFSLIKVLREEGPFDVVHTNIDFFNGVNLFAAFIAGVPVRISHSHNTNSAHARTVGTTLPIKLYRRFMRFFINLLSTEKLGCSKEANIYMYGSKAKESIVINNGVHFEKFRKNLNKENDFEVDKDKINFVTIGRMCEQKNSIFIVKVMNELIKINKNVHLYWVGQGPQEKDVRELVNEYCIEKYVSFLGARNDIPSILNNTNFLLFPSKWEGLPVTLVEAQVANLPCFISDKITDEVDLGLCTVISLEDNEKKWAEKINNYIKNSNYKNSVNNEKIKRFNIKNVAKEMEDIYLQNK